jgi:hypothetical protein
MAVQDNGTRIQYTATASQTVFPYPFEILDEDDITVVQNSTTLSKTTHYTVSGVGSDTGGNITFVTGATSGDVITIYRSMSLSRVTNYQANAAFLESEVDADFDRLWMATQQNESDATRGIRASQTDSILNSTNTELANPATRAGKVLGFDSTGALSYYASTVASADFIQVTTTAAMAALASPTVGDLVQTAEFSTGNGGGGTYDCKTVGTTANVDLPNTYNIIVSTVDATKCFVLRVGDVANVREFGATGDGVTDDLGAITAAVDYTPMAAVYFPSTTSNYSVSSNIALNSGQTAFGDGFRSKIKLTANTFAGQLIGAIGATGAVNHVRDITVRGLHLDVSDLVGENGVGFAYAENTLTTECYFTNIGRKAWTVQVECVGNKFTDSIIISAQTEVGAVSSCIAIEGESGDVNSYGNIVDNITIEDGTTSALAIFNASNNKISNITVSQNLSARLVNIVGEVGFDCVGNSISGIGSDGQLSVAVEMANAKDNIVENITADDCTGSAVIFGANTSKNRISGGVVATSAATGVTASGATATGNVVEKLKITAVTDCFALVGVENEVRRCELNSVRGVTTSGARTKIIKNDIKPTSSQSVNMSAGSDGSTIEGNTFGASGSAGINNLSADNIINDNTDLSGTPFSGGALARRSETGNSWNPRVYYATAAPTAGTHSVGDRVINTGAAVDGNNMHVRGWLCTVAGTPGTFVTLYESTVTPAT